jgi:hypothetical protein
LVEHTAENRGVAGSIPALAIADANPRLACARGMTIRIGSMRSADAGGPRPRKSGAATHAPLFLAPAYRWHVEHESFALLRDETVEEIVFGPDVRLVLREGDDEPESYIDVADGTYVAADGTEVDLRGAGRLLELRGERIVAAQLDAGELSLVFAGGARLIAKPDADHETWSVVAGGRVFQCLPGGEIASW